MNGTEIRKGNRGRGERLWSWLFLLPTILFLGFTALLPLLYSLYLSLFQYKINLPNAVPKENRKKYKTKPNTASRLGWNRLLPLSPFIS